MKFEYYGKSKKGGIYKIINLVDGKIYIGSCAEFKRRSTQHHSALKSNRHSNKHLQASFNKYGTDAFLFEAVEPIEGSKLSRTTREEDLLQEQIDLGNWNNCYNFQQKPKSNERNCFSKSPELTRQRLSKAQRKRYSKPEERKKISEGLKGRTVSKKTRKKIAESLKGKRNGLGFKQTDESKEKIRQAALNRKEQTKKKYSKSKSRAVVQFTMEGTEIKVWPSAKEAAKNLQISPSSIMNGCQQDRISCGFRWKYKEPNKHKPWSDEEMNNAYQLYVENGYDVVKTAQAIGRTYGQVYGKFKHENLLNEHSQDYTRFRKSLDGQGI